ALARYDKAIEILERLVARGHTQGRTELLNTRLYHAIALARKGGHARAADEAAAIARQEDLHPTLLYKRCLYLFSSSRSRREGQQALASGSDQPQEAVCRSGHGLLAPGGRQRL